MKNISYFDAYMRGERSSSHKMKVAGFDPILINLIRHSMPNLVARDLVGIQPMTRNTGQTFTLRPGTYTIDRPITLPPNTTIKSRALKAEYTLELTQDLKAIHGFNADAELANRGEGFRPTYIRHL
jgi:hypothetical protein